MTQSLVWSHNIESIVLNTIKFNKDQKELFNTIVGEILHEVTVDNICASIQRPLNN